MLLFFLFSKYRPIDDDDAEIINQLRDGDHMTIH